MVERGVCRTVIAAAKHWHLGQVVLVWGRATKSFKAEIRLSQTAEQSRRRGKNTAEANKMEDVGKDQEERYMFLQVSSRLPGGTGSF